MQWSSKPVALSDMLSAAPTWLAAYKEIAAGKDHGEAVVFGDRAVRRAHGSTAKHQPNRLPKKLQSIPNFNLQLLVGYS